MNIVIFGEIKQSGTDGATIDSLLMPDRNWVISCIQQCDIGYPRYISSIFAEKAQTLPECTSATVHTAIMCPFPYKTLS